MKAFGGWMFPDGETHLPQWMTTRNEVVDGRLSYQHHKLAKAVSYCKRTRCALDVGAHVGLWSYYLAAKFAHVDAFEPVAAHRECFRINVSAQNVTLLPVALGAAPAMVSIRTAPTSSGDSWVDGAGNIPLRTLDSFALDDVDFLKIDCEGGELPVLQGGAETVKRCRPVIIVEQKPGHAQRFGLAETGAVDYLQGLGYTLAAEMSGDFILTP